MKRESPALWLVCLGGVLLVVGSLLSFGKIEVPGLGVSESVGGLDTDDGKLYLGVGIALLVFGVLMYFMRSGMGRRIFAVLSVLAAGFMVYAAVIDIKDIGESVPPTFGVAVEVTAGIGLYVVLVGSVLATLGGLMALFGRAPAMDAGAGMAAPPPPPPGAPPPQG